MYVVYLFSNWYVLDLAVRFNNAGNTEEELLPILSDLMDVTRNLFQEVDIEEVGNFLDYTDRHQ